MAKFVVTGLKEAMRSLQKMGADIGNDAYEALEKAGQHLENKVEITLSDRSGPRTGRIYSTGKKGERFATHQASAPGEPPAKLTGLLIGSITHKTERLGKIGARGAVGTNEDKGLERGTSKIAPRSYMFPTMIKEAPAMTRIITKSLQTALQRYKIK